MSRDKASEHALFSGWSVGTFFFRDLLLPLNIFVIVLMLLVGYSDHIDPREHAILSTLGLSFPFFLFLNGLFVVFWLVFNRRYILVPLIGFLVSWGPVRRYCPVNMPKDSPKGAIKVLSYNVWEFATWDNDKDEMNPIVDYLLNSGADIICLQEAGCDPNYTKTVYPVLAKGYEYCVTVHKRGPTDDVLAGYSKFPILSHERIHYESKGNISVAFFLKINGRKVLLVNNHFESVGLSVEDKDRFHSLVHGAVMNDSTGEESKFFITKIGVGARKRAPQADAVAKYIHKYRRHGMSVIVCGDFNDSPISYTHRRVATGLTDCFVASGTGPGWSYHKSGIRVRIDNILCSPDLQPYGAKVDRSCDKSDHYPIYCWLKKKR